MPDKITDSEIKEFLKRVDIKTMRKDLQQLREGEVLKERKKIIELQKTEGKPRETAPPQEKTTVIAEAEPVEKATAESLKTRASEDERQKIFYFETEKAKLVKELEVLQKEKEPPFLLEKNTLLRKKGELGKALKIASEEEKKIEGEEGFISEKEKESKTPEETKRFEERKWELEGKRKEIEKKRWVKEKELADLESQIKGLDDNLQKISGQQRAIKDKIKELDSNSRTIYQQISQREEEKRRLEKEKKTLEALGQAEQEARKKEDVQRKEWTKKRIEEKSFLKGATDQTKEKVAQKLQETADKEEEERKKFLEKVQKWTDEENEPQK